MKKLFSFLVLSFLLIGQIFAVSAYPHPIEYELPDGMKITILLKGDEKVHWATSEDGYTLLLNSDGFYEYAVKDDNGDLVLSGIKVKNLGERSADDISFLRNVSKDLRYSEEQVYYKLQIYDIHNSIERNIEKHEAKRQKGFSGEIRVPVILVAFQDIPFTKTKADFDALMNQPNYTTDGATGSVYDYFLASSYGQLQMTVDVFGPYTLSQNIAAYDSRCGGNPDYMVKEAAEAAHADGCDFSNYDDFDNDDIVDGFHIIFAGYGQEAGAPACHAIWSHQGFAFTDIIYIDGKLIEIYSCSPELRGNSGSNITHIGVIAHEMSHVFGVPDLYDIDYEGTGGESIHIGPWDIMASGSWNDNGRTPALHSAWTRNQLGWIDITTLTQAATVTIPNPETTGACYRVNTTTENEYFLLENRQKTGWDAYIPGSGMLIYHVDENHSNWPHRINIDPSHRCLYIKQANGGANSTATHNAGAPYPGTSSNTSFTDTSTPNSKSWAGANTAKPITDITHNTTDKTISFDFMGGAQYCTLGLSSNPPSGGTTDGGGTFISGTNVTVEATANQDYVFDKWTNNGTTVSTTPTYTFTITEDIDLVANFKNTDATLSALSVSTGTLTPAFDPETTEYNVSVDNTVTSITIDATANYSAAIVVGAGVKSLNIGSNSFNITVTAEDGTTTKTYTVIVTKAASNDATLSNLIVSEGTLTPVFAPTTTEYSVSVPNEIETISITGTANHGYATVVGNVNNATLAVGVNSFDIVVTAEDGVTKKYYYINVIRLETFTPTADGRLYVKKSATGTGKGNSWENAIPELAYALKFADDNLGAVTEIWVAAGTYYPLYRAGNGTTDRDKAFLMVKDVKLYGGFAGNEANLIDRDWETNETILSGDFENNDDFDSENGGYQGTTGDDNANHVIIAVGDIGEACLDGFCITGGNAIGSGDSITVNGSPVFRDNGGGIYAYITAGITEFCNNKVYNNNAFLFGGGIFADATADAKVHIIDNTVHDNTATFGGGIYAAANVYVNNNTVHDNTATNGGGICLRTTAANVYVNNNTVHDNTANNGGGIYARANADANVYLNNNTIHDNTSYTGGGIYAEATTATAYIYINNNTLYSNFADFRGGGIFAYMGGKIGGNIQISNNTVHDNTASTGRGGGIYALSLPNSNIQVNNNTVYANIANDGGGGIFTGGYNAQVNNNTIYANLANTGGGIYVQSAAYAAADATADVYTIVYVNNNTVYDNNATKGGGVYVSIEATADAATADAYANIYVNNNTVYDNNATEGGGIYTYANHSATADAYAVTNVYIYNSIIWNEDTAAPAIVAERSANSTINIAHCFISGEENDLDDTILTIGAGNVFGIAPGFTDAATGNFNLVQGSPCIDAGNNELYLNNGGTINDTDMAGNPRIYGDIIDIGAYEFSDGKFNINLVASPTEGGIVEGTGYYDKDATALVKAIANSDYIFINWTENSTIVSTDANYSFTVTKSRNLVANFKNTDATLSALSVSTGTLTPVFDPETIEYNVMVDNTVTSITIDATANNSAAIVVGAGVKSLNIGPNPFNITVTAEDGVTEKIYSVTVYRVANDDASLIELSVTPGVLSPVFESGTTEYTVTVEYSVENITIAATATNYQANVEGTGVKQLSVGDNRFVITVTAVDGITETEYEIIVTRQDISNDATLSNLIVGEGTLTPVFAPTTTEYSVSVANEIETISITGTANHAFATVVGNVENAILTVGNNSFDIVVTAEDGTTTKTYAVIVTRAASNDATLSNLIVSEGTLTPVFAPTTTEYSVSVANEIETISITGTANHGYATVVGNVNNATLAVGVNSFDIVVTAEDEVTKEYYYINVIRMETSTPTADGRLYVKKSATGTGKGNSWENAIPELADALKFANDNPGEVTEIWVAAGTYKPTEIAGNGTSDRDKTFLMAKDVKLYGGFPADANDIDHTSTVISSEARNPSVNETILSGDIDNNDYDGDGNYIAANNVNNAYHVVVVAGDMGEVCLDGFCITGGNANGGDYKTVNGRTVHKSFGGGINAYISADTTKFCNNKVYNNYASYGGGIYAYTYANATVYVNNNTIHNNTARSQGGGIYADTRADGDATVYINNNTVHNNTAFRAGGIYAEARASTDADATATVYVNNNTVHNNTASGDGAGIFAYAVAGNSTDVYTTVYVNNNTVYDNTASYGGGGIYAEASGSADATATVYVDNNTVHNNTAYEDGGGIHAFAKALTDTNTEPTVYVNNNTIYKNTARNGGGIYARTLVTDDEATVYVNNNTVYDNTASYDGGGIYAYANANVAAPDDAFATVYVNNNTVHNNIAYIYGVGIYAYARAAAADATVYLNNNTIAYNNTASFGPAGIYTGTNASANASATVHIYNSIIWIDSPNTPAIMADKSGDGTQTINLANCFVNGNEAQLNTNITKVAGNIFAADEPAPNDNPQFVDADYKNFRLQGNSPCIDEGDNDLYWYSHGETSGDFANEFDNSGNPRLVGSTIDIGAYEYSEIYTDNGRLYVKKNATGTNEGNNWENAIPELADALKFANDYPGAVNEIWVAAGTYYPLYKASDQAGTDDRDKAFVMAKDVKIYGGFPADANDTDHTSTVISSEARNPSVNETILSGDFGNDDNFDIENGGYQGTTGNDNSYHVVIVAGDMGKALLDGFCITGGNANVNSTINVNGINISRRDGGGIYAKITADTTEFCNNKVYNNAASRYGGGIYADADTYASGFTATVYVNNNTVYENTASRGGGGIRLHRRRRLRHCLRK